MLLRPSRERDRGQGRHLLNEVWMIANSILQNGGVRAADKTIQYKPETSVLKLKVGDRIELSAVEFARLAEAFITQMEAKFV
jgi:hypothetical protein